MVYAPYLFGAVVTSRLEQRWLWLVSPILNWQSLPHQVQVWVVAGLSPHERAFRLALFFSARF